MDFFLFLWFLSLRNPPICKMLSETRYRFFTTVYGPILGSWFRGQIIKSTTTPPTPFTPYFHPHIPLSSGISHSLTLIHPLQYHSLHTSLFPSPHATALTTPTPDTPFKPHPSPQTNTRTLHSTMLRHSPF